MQNNWTYFPLFQIWENPTRCGWQVVGLIRWGPGSWLCKVHAERWGPDDCWTARKPGIWNPGHQAIGMELVGLANQEKAKGMKLRNQSGKAGAGSFLRDEAIEEVSEFDAVQVCNWIRKSDRSWPGEFCFSNCFHRSHRARIIRVKRKQWQPERKSNALW